MKRWHLTLGLGSAAAIGMAAAPRLPRGVEDVRPVPAASAGPSWEDPWDPSDRTLLIDGGFERTQVLADARAQVRFLTIGLEGRARPVTTRAPVDLAVVVDTSASMGANGKLDQARRATLDLARRLGPPDNFSLVTFADDATVLVPYGPVIDVARIDRVLASVYQGGSSNLYAGLQQGGHTLASADPDRHRHVVLLSDGEANVGVLDAATVRRLAKDLQAEGMTVSTVGLGLDYDEDLLAALADAGGGSYHFVDEATSLTAVLEDELARADQVAVRGVWVEVLLPEPITLADALGWTEEGTTDGFRVFVGDLAAGERRKVVLKVTVDGADHVDPVLVRAIYRDSADPSLSRTAVIRAPLQVATDPAAVDGSVHHQRAVEALRAQAGASLEVAVGLWEQGSRASAGAAVRAAANALRDGAARWSEPALARDAQALEQIAASAGVAEDDASDVRWTKTTKELARVLAR